MKRLLPVLCALGFFTGRLPATTPYKILPRSVSASQQFIIYCDSMATRFAVSTFCEETKTGILKLLSQRDEWKVPIVVTLYRPDAASPGQPLSQIQVLNLEGGAREIELNVTLRGDLADIHFQQQLIHAILLEMEYRDQPVWHEDAPFIDPPQWLVEGLAVYLSNRNKELDTGIYKTLLDNSTMPSLEEFLGQTTEGMNAASMKLYQAYAFSFLQLIAGLPGGPQGLAWYVHDLPLGHDTPSGDLIKHFPALGGSEENLEKWWTLSMAHLSEANVYKGMSVEETDSRVTALLQFKIPTGKSGETKIYTIDDFTDFVKNPQARPVLAASIAAMQSFSAQANPVFRPIIVNYLQLMAELQHGKIKHTADRLKDMAKYRELILTRMDQIADYMNWFEATQIVSRSDSFEDYMKTAKQLSTETPHRDDPVSRYLDSIEIQMQ